MNPLVAGLLAALLLAGVVLASGRASARGHDPARCEPRTPLSEIQRCLRRCIDLRTSCSPCRKHFAACATTIWNVLTLE